MNTNKNTTMTVPVILWFFGLSCLTVFLFTCNPTPKVADEVDSPLSTLHSSLIEPTGNAKLDSLLQLAATMPQDTVLAKLYYQIGDIYENHDFEKAKAYYLKLKTLSEDLDWNEGRYLSSAGFALILLRTGLVDSALVICLQSLELAKKEMNERWIANINSNTGNCYGLKDWHETALQYYMEALSFYEKINDTERLGATYWKIADVYQNMNLIEKAVEFGQKAVAIRNNDPSALITLAMAYHGMYEYEKAKTYLEEALRICELQNNAYLIEFIYYHLSANAVEVYELDKAGMYLEKMRTISGENFSFEMPYLVVYGKLESLKGNFARAEKYALQALELAEEQGALRAKKVICMMLCELTLAQRRFRENTQYYEKLYRVEVAIANETAVRSSAEMEAKYENAKKELEIARQQEVIARQNMQRGLLVGGIAVSAVILLLLWYMLHLRTRRNRALTERNDTLSEMNATKDKFFSIISHDLKNPAVAQRDALQMLVKNARLWDVDTLTDYYLQLLESAEGEVELIFNLLGWAQIQTGRLSCAPGTFDISNVMPNLSLITGICNNKGITLVTQIPKNVLIICDSNMISTVIRNLLTNAIKFTPSGGTVTLSVEQTDSPPQQKTRITITDTGIGMNREQIDQLFCLDSKQSREGTAGEQGSGLGLIVCRELLGKHGSTLQVESEEGKGSRFWFEV